MEYEPEMGILFSMSTLFVYSAIMFHRIIILVNLLTGLLVSQSACKMHTGVVDVKLDSFVDTAVYAIIPYDQSMESMNWRYKNVRSGKLTATGVDSLELIIESACKAYNEKYTDDTLYQVMPLQKYYRQYVPVVTVNGERVVWVGFFCSKSSNSSWRKLMRVVNDGGNCYFQLFIDVNRREVYDLYTNGYAFLPGRFRTIINYQS